MRTCFLIVGNMCKLVEAPAEALLFLSRLELLANSVTVEIADTEVRGVAEKAYEKLQKGCWCRQRRGQAAGGQGVRGSVASRTGGCDQYMAPSPQPMAPSRCSGYDTLPLRHKPTLMRLFASERWEGFRERDGWERFRGARE